MEQPDDTIIEVIFLKEQASYMSRWPSSASKLIYGNLLVQSEGEVAGIALLRVRLSLNTGTTLAILIRFKSGKTMNGCLSQPKLREA